jgi:site-specific DNA-cytosine methylase
MSPVRDMDDGISPRLAREQLQALGNAVVPQCAEIIGWMIREIIEGTKQA